LIAKPYYTINAAKCPLLPAASSIMASSIIKLERHLSLSGDHYANEKHPVAGE
jgi:hypothetical protein